MPQANLNVEHEISEDKEPVPLRKKIRRSKSDINFFNPDNNKQSLRIKDYMEQRQMDLTSRYGL